MKGVVVVVAVVVVAVRRAVCSDMFAKDQCYFYTLNTPSFHSTSPKQQCRTPPWNITCYDYSVRFESGRYVSNLTADANRN
jgi:hypothetical protein